MFIGEIYNHKLPFVHNQKLPQRNLRSVMVSNPVKSGFALRLRELCEDAALPERGRQTLLAKKFAVSQQAAKKWLSGESLPELDKVVAIADWGGVTVNWLLQGFGPKRGDHIETKSLILTEAIENLPTDSKQQVLDFISYKIERADGLFVGERLAKYMTMLDAFKRSPRKPG